MSNDFVTDADIYAGKQIRRLRKSRGFSQVALADALGVSFQQVQKYERGQNRITVGKISQIARFFNMPIIYFFEVPEEQANFLKNYVRCTRERRKILYALAQTYAQEEAPSDIGGNVSDSSASVAFAREEDVPYNFKEDEEGGEQGDSGP